MPDLTDKNDGRLDVAVQIEKVCGDIDSILTNKAESHQLSQEYAKTRLLELKEEPASPKDLSSLYANSWSGYIHEGTEIHSNMMFNGFVLNDNDVYTELLEVMMEMHENPSWEGESAKSMTGQAIDIEVNRYFGNRFSDDGVSERRKQIYANNSHMGQKAFSVKEFKGMEASECVEKAALGSNLFCFLGYESKLILSKHTKLDGENEEPHAYLYINDGKVKRIVDLTNPTCAFDASGRLLSARVAVYKLSEEQVSLFEGGKEISITHNDYVVNPDGSKTPKSSIRKYSPN